MGRSTNSESHHNQQQKQAQNENIPDNEFGTEMYPGVKETNQKNQKKQKQGRRRSLEPKNARNAKNYS